MRATWVRASIVIGCCLVTAGCGQQDDGTSLSGTSLTTAASTWGDPEEGEGDPEEESEEGDPDESDEGTCEEGSAGCPCYGNGTCDDGLQCSDGVCVPPGGDGDGDEGDGDGDPGDGDPGDGDGDPPGDGDGEPPGDGDGDVYSAFGPQIDVPIADVVGWEVCYTAPYIDETPMNEVLSDCNGDHLMLACKDGNANAYTVLAHAPRADVLMNQDFPYTPHVANGSGWYYELVAVPGEFGGFGFAGAGDPVQTNPCDVEQNIDSDERLCWHTSNNAMYGGFRCGPVLLLNESLQWQRVILHRND